MIRTIGLSSLLLCGIMEISLAQSTTYLNWQRFIDGSALQDDSSMVVEATATGVIVGSNITNTTTMGDILISSYDVNGQLLWTYQYASFVCDESAHLQINALNGDIYVVGSTYDMTNEDALIFKLDKNGNLQWSKTFDGVYGGEDAFLNLKILPDGSVIAVGESEISQITCNGMIVKYDVQGNLVWTTLAGGQSGETHFNRLEIDGSSKIYASGYTFNGTNTDGYVAQFDSTGTMLWSTAINGAGNKDDEVKGLEFMNNVLYVATVGRGAGSYDEAIITAYGDDGQTLWTNTYASLNGDIDLAGMQYNEISGNLLLAGEQGNLTSYPPKYFLTLSYNAATGELNWAKTTTRGTSYNSVATAMDVDASGNLLITGNTTKLAGAAVDMFTVEYDDLGNLLWTKVFNGPGNGNDSPSSIGVNSGNFYIGGYSVSSTGDKDAAVLKYSASLICSVPSGLFTSDVTGSSAKLNWDPMTEVKKYKVQYKIVGGSWITNTTTGTSFSLAGLSASTEYQWRVKTTCKGTTSTSSDWSSKKSFTTGGLRLTNTADESAPSITLFPNPAGGIIDIQWRGVRDNNLKVTLYDLAGRALKSSTLTSGDEAITIQMDVADLASGSYMIAITGDQTKMIERFVKQ